jgi:small subunit ribosomal protein S1
LRSNETREFFILTDENEDGQLTLIDSPHRVYAGLGAGAPAAAGRCHSSLCVFATNRGGALVRIEGLRGFIPGSHISTRKPKEDLVAEELPLKFLEVDEERNRLVLSHRRALVERKMNGLQVGKLFWVQFVVSSPTVPSSTLVASAVCCTFLRFPTTTLIPLIASSMLTTKSRS